ncbi:DUF2069 domain-containing protein [Gammaproteobacteria bacterium]|jgi:uncharacterized membrane protein|nr:DUF2069 domain-containing protein [Gammaproteobacteria bacterium]MDA9802391.1 DUF2069 domain-containing protein [Gammaproteobacteria bacterium]MDC1013185.1 DUF2069 domain-containing protein [Gammaproteobacteria bacterium]
MNLRKSFLTLIAALLITHLLQGLSVGTPLIGIFIWSLPLIIFGYKAYKSPSAKLYQIFGFIILIYFMSACLIVFGLPNAGLLSWLELIEIVALFLVAVYAAREQLNVK